MAEESKQFQFRIAQIQNGIAYTYTQFTAFVVDTYSLYTTNAGANIVCSLRQDTTA